MVRLIHFSDWHGRWQLLPPADIYVCTGDMTRNHTGFSGRQIKPELEKALQEEELRKIGCLRTFLPERDAPVVVVRGNHDYVDLGPFFGGDYFEITEDPTRTVEYCGLRFGGFRGVPPVGEWNDLLTPRQMALCLESLPEDLDVLVTHGPPKHILASVFGSAEYLGYLYDRAMEGKSLPKLCCFGHIHEAAGKVHQLGLLLSNAALQYNVIDLCCPRGPERL